MLDRRCLAPGKLRDSVKQSVKVADAIQTIPIDGMPVSTEVARAIPVSKGLLGDTENSGGVTDLQEIPPRHEALRHTSYSTKPFQTLENREPPASTCHRWLVGAHSHASSFETRGLPTSRERSQCVESCKPLPGFRLEASVSDLVESPTAVPESVQPNTHPIHQRQVQAASASVVVSGTQVIEHLSRP